MVIDITIEIIKHLQVIIKFLQGEIMINRFLKIGFTHNLKQLPTTKNTQLTSPVYNKEVVGHLYHLKYIINKHKNLKN